MHSRALYTPIEQHRVLFPSVTYIIQEQERGLAPMYHAEGGMLVSPSSPGDGAAQRRGVNEQFLPVNDLDSTLAS
jgi:hypothetical protein